MRSPRILTFTLAIVLAFFVVDASARAQQPTPDLTRGGKSDATHDWNLGPTGARGWIAGHDLATSDARQILITKVEKGSPADGVLEVGDVLLGVGGARFESDARRAFGAAITAAERDENHGQLDVLRWRKSATERVKLHLAVLGTYSDTAPADCPKSKRIREQAAHYLAEHGLGDSIVARINALALLATGLPEYRERVKALAYEVGPPTLALHLETGMCAWDWGITNLFLAEYFLSTGDRHVLPAIEKFSKAMAAGQSAVGTWGHGMVVPGSVCALGGYGAINQPGLVCWLSLVLAEKCGVKDANVHAAIERSRRFFAFYVGKGSIPYGDHAPYDFLHDNNGKNAAAAIAFDLLGDKDAARFFARTSTASYAELELGHTGNYFGYLWGPLGVARAGREALAAHLKEQRWYYDLARRWDGGFDYQGGAGEDDSYAGWDMTGVFLLSYALPLHQLEITGKSVRAENALVGAELRSVIEDGRDFDSAHMQSAYLTRSNATLLSGLKSWSPTVRYRSANALALHHADVIPKLTELLQSAELDARYGACRALEFLGPAGAPAVDALIAQLAHPDSWLQIRAAFALANIGAPARKAVPVLLAKVLSGTPDEPREMTRKYLGLALFLQDFIDTGPKRGLIADSIDGVESRDLVEAVRRVLALDDGLARSQVASVYDHLSEDQLAALWPDILRSVQVAAPSGEMYADGIRVAGLKLMAKHRIQEGMRACVDYARSQNSWASETRMAEIMQTLATYGAAAQSLLPELRAIAQDCRDEQDFPDDCKKQKVAAVEQAIESIANSTARPELVSLAPPPTPSTNAAAKKVKVFVLAGQSNMEGPAVADLDPSWDPADYNGGRGTLTELLRDPRNAARYGHLRDAHGHWTVRDDVWVRYQLEDGTLKKGPLALGFTPYDEHHFGPELQFGHVVGNAFDEPVLLVKTAWGGKSLYADFRPPSSGGTVGPYYTRMIAEIRAALSRLAHDFPALAGREAELAGFVWYQGWNDGCDPEHAAPEYEANLVNLIHDVRREFGAPALPFVIGELTGPWVKAEDAWELVRRAQAAVAARAEFAGNVAFVATHDFVRKPEDSPHPEHGHHEFGNAETYFLVGDALGDAMTKLCAAKSK